MRPQATKKQKTKSNNYYLCQKCPDRKRATALTTQLEMKEFLYRDTLTQHKQELRQAVFQERKKLVPIIMALVAYILLFAQ